VDSIREGKKTTEYSAQEDGEFSDVPLVVLVNRRSASASEILSAALQDNGRAVVAGERTWGKGVGQTGIPMAIKGEQSKLVLTTLWWYSPAGRSIHSDVRGQGGVEPDIKLSGDDDSIRAYVSTQHGLLADGKWDLAEDPWLQKAAEIARGLPVPGGS
jgi:C-terminal processing protease CtpA/Prc